MNFSRDFVGNELMSTYKRECINKCTLHEQEPTVLFVLLSFRSQLI